MKRLIVSLAACAAVAAGAASAQSIEAYQQRQADLSALAAVFGELHHIRRNCEPRLEADVWRERMKRLVDLEQPQFEVRETMVKSFNKGYSAAQQHFPDCSRRARDHAAARAVQGEAIIARLSAPLREAAAQDENAPFLWSDGVIRE